MVLKANVNIVGPNGELVKAGDEIPEDWDEEFVQSLKDTGGAAVGRKDKK